MVAMCKQGILRAMLHLCHAGQHQRPRSCQPCQHIHTHRLADAEPPTVTPKGKASTAAIARQVGDQCIFNCATSHDWRCPAATSTATSTADASGWLVPAPTQYLKVKPRHNHAPRVTLQESKAMDSKACCTAPFGSKVPFARVDQVHTAFRACEGLGTVG